MAEGRKGGALRALEPKTRKVGRSQAEIENDKLRKEKDELARKLRRPGRPGRDGKSTHSWKCSPSADSDDKHKK